MRNKNLAQYEWEKKSYEVRKQRNMNQDDEII